MPKEKPEEHSKAKRTRDKPNEAAVVEPRSYYYDDAHGYEEYDPKKDAEDKDDEFDD